MIFKRRTDILTPITQPTGTTAQTISFRIKQEQRRLEGLVLQIEMTPNAAAATGAAWGGYAGIVKEVRLKVQDGIGSRNVIQASGIGLMSYVRQNFGTLDRVTQGVYGSSGFPTAATAATVVVSWFIPIRHPLIGEPYGNYLSLPLSANFLGDDVIVEVDLNDITAAASVFTATPPTYTANGVHLMTLIREVPESWGYIPSELRTDNFTPSGVANALYEFASTGYLTQVLTQTISTATFTAASTRVTPLSTGGNVRFEYGREIQQRSNLNFNQAIQDLSMQAYPLQTLATIASSALGARNFPELFFDFLSDLPNANAFSAASVQNLYTSALGGDKARLVFNDYSSTTNLSQITMHRLLPLKADDLKSLSAGL